jgi:hypothetical protein
VLSCSLDFDMTLIQIRASCSSTSMCSEKIPVSPHFGNEISLWRIGGKKTKCNIWLS